MTEALVARESAISATQEQMLARLGQAREALAFARSVGEVKEIRDGAEAIRAWSRQRDDSLEIQNGAAELKLRAERRLGELLKETPKHPGGRPAANSLHDGRSLPTLKEQGISEVQSHRWQQIAAVPEEKFAAYVEQQNTEREEITSADLLRLAKSGSLLDRKQDATRADSDERDDFQTPDWALDVILPYLDPSWAIWECAAGKGNLVRGFRERGFRCDSSDIRSGADFLKADHPHPYDCIITNPPYSAKDDFLRRCYALGKPFALLMPAGALFEKGRMALYREYGIRVVAPDRRINFETPTGRGEGDSSAWFFSAWFTWGLSIPAAPCDVTFWMPGPREADDGDQSDEARTGDRREVVGGFHPDARDQSGAGGVRVGGQRFSDSRLVARPAGHAGDGEGEPGEVGERRVSEVPILARLEPPCAACGASVPDEHGAITEDGGVLCDGCAMPATEEPPTLYAKPLRLAL